MDLFQNPVGFGTASNKKIIEYGQTAHNRIVYISPAKVPSGYVLPALVFTAQGPYPGWQNFVNNRNLMCNAWKTVFFKKAP
jgi:hypothetical protein